MTATKPRPPKWHLPPADARLPPAFSGIDRAYLRAELVADIARQDAILAADPADATARTRRDRAAATLQRLGEA